MILILVSSLIALISGQTLTYVFLEDGSPLCSTRGLWPINDANTCKWAVNILSGRKGYKPVKMLYVHPDGNINIPSGCFKQEGRLYFNNFLNEDSAGSCNSDTRCLCIGEASSSIGQETHLPSSTYFETEEDCRAAAIRFGLTPGGAGHDFVSVGEGTALTKGCYGYYLGKFKGMAFWVTGHGRYSTTRKEIPHCPKFRLIEVDGKMVPPGPDEGTCKLDDCPAQCLDVRGEECHKCVSSHNYCGHQDHFCDGGLECWGCAMNPFPTPKPTIFVSKAPTPNPTKFPTHSPTTTKQTISPTLSPSQKPTLTEPPTPEPSTAPSPLPTTPPSKLPTPPPTTLQPTTPRPTFTEPTTSPTPLIKPASKPTALPTLFGESEIRGFLRDGCMDVKFKALCSAFPECAWIKDYCISNNAGCFDTMSSRDCTRIARKGLCYKHREECKLTCGCCNKNAPNKCVAVVESPELCVFGGYWKNCALSCEMCIIREDWTHKPTQSLTMTPTPEPATSTITLKPSISPTQTTPAPSTGPTFQPTRIPSQNPSHSPSINPTFSPTIVPSFSPTIIPSNSPTSPDSTPNTKQPTLDLNDIRDGCMDVKIRELCLLLEECAWTNRLCIANNNGCEDKLGFKECKKIVNKGQCLEKRDECRLSCGCCNLNAPKKCVAVVENPDLCFLGGYWKNCALSCDMCAFSKDG